GPSLCFRPNIRVHALPNVLGSAGRTPCCLQNAMYDPLRCSFATLVPRSSDSVLPFGPAGLRIALALMHDCDHRVMPSPFVFCWRRPSLSSGGCPLSNGFIAFRLFVFVFVGLRLDCQRLVELEHFTSTSGQIDPNDESIAPCRGVFLRPTRCDRAQFSAGFNAMPGRQICVVDDAV